jgi:hypothetical protein
LGRYRPFITILTAAAVVLVLLPAITDPDEGGSAGLATGGAAVASGGLAGGGATVGTSVAGGPGGGASDPGAAGVPATAAPGGAPATEGGGASPEAAATSATGAGAGSEAALAAPDCDPATGRIMVPFKIAPPCVVPWQDGADNGGATTRGVTATEIKVAVLVDGETDSQVEQNIANSRDMVQLFNHAYRTWGRQIVPVFVRASGTDEAAQRADAIAIAALEPFALITDTGGGLITEAEVARRGIVTFPTIGTQLTVRDSLAQAPYRWAEFPSDLHTMAANAEFIGEALAGRPARWAGSPVLQTQERVFGVVYPTMYEVGYFQEQLASYGAEVAVALPYDYLGGLGDPALSQQQAPTIINRLKAAGVTTIVAFTDPFLTGALTQQATLAQFSPEWINTGFAAQDYALLARTYDQSQWAHAFGITPLPAIPAGGGPNPYNRLFRWYWGDESDNYFGRVMVGWMWLATGVHMAGPNLTPTTFRDGLFAYPASGGASCDCRDTSQYSWGRTVGFPFDDYIAWDDFQMVWWSATDIGPGNADAAVQGSEDVEVIAPGNWWYIHDARHFAPGQLPNDEPPMFDRANARLTLDGIHPNDAVPEYPCNGCPSTT